jgi:hypothetical protein
VCCKLLKTNVVTWLHEVPYIYIGIGICNLYPIPKQERAVCQRSVRIYQRIEDTQDSVG